VAVQEDSQMDSERRSVHECVVIDSPQSQGRIFKPPTHTSGVCLATYLFIQIYYAYVPFYFQK